MKLSIKSISMIALMAVGQTAHSAGTGTVDIDTISVGSTGIVYLETLQSQINPANCSESRYAIDTELPGARHMYMLALTARVSNLSLNISIDNNRCVIIGSKSYPKVFNMVTR